MLSFLAALPVIGNIITALTTAFYNAKVQIVTAQIGGDVEKAKQIVSATNVAQQERVAGLAIISGNMILTILVVAFAAPLVIFEWKDVVWDKVLGLGTTDEIHGQVADWAKSIIWAIFGSGSAVTVSRMWFGKKS